MGNAIFYLHYRFYFRYFSDGDYRRPGGETYPGIVRGRVGKGMKSKADIKLDYSTNEIFVLDKKGKEVFRKPKTEQHISLANSIYMYHKYGK